jgi:hypothetical protein
MTLSSSQLSVLNAIKRQGIRYLPKGANIVTEDDNLWRQLAILGCKWEWSRTIDIDAFISDYRRRIWEINQIPGYRIIPFHAPWEIEKGSWIKPKIISRHGYILISEPKEEEKEILEGQTR